MFAHMRNLRQSDFEYSLSKTFKSGRYINVNLHKCINMYKNVHLHIFISAFDDIRTTITLVYIHIFTYIYAHIKERQLKIMNQNYVEKKLVRKTS